MSYNNTSYYKSGGPVSGMSRGRGYSGPMRGSMRSRGSADGSSWSGRGRGRGYGMHTSRGGSSMTSGTSNYSNNSSSSNWYNKDSTGGPPQQPYRNDRYSSSVRQTENRYPSSSNRGSSVDQYSRRYSRQDAPSYSSNRDHSHHRSPEGVPRKRIRSEGYPVASSRRSHDGSYEYSSSRYEFGSDKSSYGNEERARPVYRDERRPSADRREEYHSPRSREPSGSSMPPPSLPVRGTSYRGRLSTRGRGVSRVYTRRPIDASLAVRKRTLVETYALKRRILTGRNTDYLKRLKSFKLRSSALVSVRKEGVKSDHGDSEDDLENWDDDDADKDVDNSDHEANSKPDDEDDDDGEEAKKKKVVRKIIKKVVRKKLPTQAVGKDSEESKDGSKEDGDANKGEEDDNREELEEEEVIEEEVEVDADENADDAEPKMQVTIKQDSETRAVSEEGGRLIGASGAKPGYRYIRLYCPHCKVRYVTFKEYQNHLRGLPHVSAMRKLSLRLKQNLAHMRVEQRIQQRLEEKNDELRGVAGSRTNFCPTCKLNYRQERARHIESEMHKKMKEFLMPFCDICRISFKSPMLFENHICSLDHIKMEERNRNRDRERHLEKDIDMDNLLILDSVGSADESESDGENSKEKDESEADKKDRKKKPQINLGADYVKKVEVMYCELCAIYLPRTGDQDGALANHCRTRNHLQRYVRYRDDRALRREAERIHRRDQLAQEARHKAREEKKKEGKDDGSVSGTDTKGGDEEGSENMKIKAEPGGSSTGGVTEAGSEGADMDDKIWADVDKGLDELLREVEPGNKSSDDDDESGRYDRFRYSDKKGGKASLDGMDVDGNSHSNSTSNADATSKQEPGCSSTN